MHRLIAWWLLCWVMVVGGSPCHFTLKDPHGHITTPNFPDPYPLPISCQWVIEAPPDKVIAVYFTQFYMREGLRATEYAYYSPNVKMGKQEFGTISSDREPTYLVSNKPVLVLNFVVREANNIHMRVREYLLDVFGFNITYEFLSRNDSVRKDACLYHHCSFTGNCYASYDHTAYNCSCFAKYFGDECQYDDECGPRATRNMCLNGGTCRYYIGSTVRTCECPSGYDGARCEAKKVAKQIGCSGESCNVTCAHGGCTQNERRKRYIVALKLTNPKVTTILSDRKKMDTFKKDMEHALFLLFKGRLEVIENITVLEVQSSSVMTFHMLSTEADGEELKLTLEQMLQLGKLGSFDFDHHFQEIQAEPGLSIAAMVSSDAMTLAEGTELTLACMIEGSEGMRVQWFKDGHPVHVRTGHRSMFTTIVPKNSEGHYTALLGFDRVTVLDSGVFTCEVHDWGFVRNRSMSVMVVSAPQPQVTPMTLAVAHSSPVVVTCLSREDPLGDFGYTWLKDGHVLNPSTEPEIAEDLFPAGSRILVPEATHSAVYSCIITSWAGSTRKDSVVTLVDTEQSGSWCPPEDYLKVRWTLTAANTENIQLCPSGYTGDVRRRCCLDSKESAAIWKEPDFSGCFSNGFLSLRKKVETLKLGYLLSDTASLLSKLKRYLLSKKSKLHFCEGEPIVDVLQDIHDIPHGDTGNQEGWATFLDISSVLLESPILIKKQEKLLQLHDLLLTHAFNFNNKSNNDSYQLFERKYLAVQLGRIGHLQKSVRLPTKAISPVEKIPSLQFDWMTNSVEIDIRNAYYSDQGNSSSSIVGVFYRNLSSHLPRRYFAKKGLADVEYQLISSLVGVKVHGDIQEEDLMVRVSLKSFNHTISDKRLGWNISCGIADTKFGTLQFTTTSCHVLSNSGNTTTCECSRMGTYALLLTHFIRPEEVIVGVNFDVVAGSGCAICAFFLLITLAQLLSRWRKIRGPTTSLKIQICAALLGAFGLFFSCLAQLISEEFYSYTISFLMIFLLTAFSLQLCVALAVYIESVDLRNVQYSFTKIAALGWAIPVIIVGATLAAQSLEGYAVERWWLTMGSNFFYAYTSSILILYMFQVLLFVIIRAEIKNYRKISDFIKSKKVLCSNHRLSLLQRSFFVTTALLFFSMSSILYVNFEDKVYEYLFSISSVLVGIVVFLSYTLCSEKHFTLCCLKTKSNSINHQDDSDVSRGDSFKSFLKPEIVDDVFTKEMDAEKRSERIRRMYSQIEKASLSDSLLPPHAPVFKPQAQQDPFCDPSEGNGYPKMHWRYADHPHMVDFDSEADGLKGLLAESAETIVQCETKVKTPLHLITKELTSHTQTWNMTTV